MAGITESLEFLREWARMCCHRMPCAGTILGAEKNRSGSIKQAHGITKIIALFRGLEGDVRRFRDVLL